MEIDVQTTRQSVRPLHGLWKAGEAPRATKPGDCAQKSRKLCATMKRMMPSSTTRLVEATSNAMAAVKNEGACAAAGSPRADDRGHVEWRRPDRRAGREARARR